MKNVQFCGKTSKFLPKREREEREGKRKRKRERGEREREREREREKFVLNFELVIISEKSKI